MYQKPLYMAIWYKNKYSMDPTNNFMNTKNAKIIKLRSQIYENK